MLSPGKWITVFSIPVEFPVFLFPTSGITVYESDGTSSTYARSAQIDALTADKTFHIEGTGATGAYPNVRAAYRDW